MNHNNPDDMNNMPDIQEEVDQIRVEVRDIDRVVTEQGTNLTNLIATVEKLTKTVEKMAEPKSTWIQIAMLVVACLSVALVAAGTVSGAFALYIKLSGSRLETKVEFLERERESNRLAVEDLKSRFDANKSDMKRAYDFLNADIERVKRDKHPIP